MTVLPEKDRVRVSGGELACVDLGEPENPAVVLLHGFPTSAFLWREFVPLLSQWFRVIAPDLLGYGDSDKPTRGELHIRAQAGCVRELLAHLGIERFAVAGHGAGGGVAQLLALGVGVEAMILIDSVAFDGWPDEATRELRSLPPEQEREDLALALITRAFDLGMGHRDRLSDEDLAEFRRPWEGEEGMRAYFRAARAIDGAGLAGTEEQLAALECPVLILWGEDDPFFPVEVAERLNDAMPTSALALLPGCSHFVTEDAAESVAPLLYEYLRVKYLKRGHDHAHEGPIPVVLGRRPTPEEEGLDQ